MYGFLSECTTKLQVAAWYTFTSVFRELPLAAIVATSKGKAFCCHGGLSPGIMENCVDTLAMSVRQGYGQGLGETEDVIDGLLWSDPSDRHQGFQPNMRGCGATFGEDATKQFLHNNGFELVIRAHQMVMRGMYWEHSGKLLTVFSAPNYCNISGNLGCIAVIRGDATRRTTTQSDVSSPNASAPPEGAGDAPAAGGGGLTIQKPLTAELTPLVPMLAGDRSPIAELIDFISFDCAPMKLLPPAKRNSTAEGETVDCDSMMAYFDPGDDDDDDGNAETNSGDGATAPATVDGASEVDLGKNVQ
jgi:diadenosine tetraphosphatase ApaH/serine/threonine PP2A family protein phosphatase